METVIYPNNTNNKSSTILLHYYVYDVWDLSKHTHTRAQRWNGGRGRERAKTLYNKIDTKLTHTHMQRNGLAKWARCFAAVPSMEMEQTYRTAMHECDVYNISSKNIYHREESPSNVMCIYARMLFSLSIAVVATGVWDCDCHGVRKKLHVQKSHA